MHNLADTCAQTYTHTLHGTLSYSESQNWKIDEIFVTQMAVGFLSAVRGGMRPPCIMEHSGALLSAAALCLVHGTKLSAVEEHMVIPVVMWDFYKNI